MTERHNYTKGERVRWSALGRARLPGHKIDRRGVVAADPRGWAVAVRWDGTNRPQYMSPEYIEPAADGEQLPKQEG